MAVLEINPEYEPFLQRHELADVDRLVDLPGVIICGHPDRHVRQVRLGSGREAMTAILKREHRVGWRQRLANAWAGFGFVSLARRELRVLRQLRRAGVPSSEWIAAGEDDHGRAFLLLRAVSNSTDLAEFLRHKRRAAPEWRRLFACRLGVELAHVHEAGFIHPGLFAKHVLVNVHDNSLCLLDWHRSRKVSDVPWPQRWCDLAALHATLAEDLAGPRERLAFLRAYLRASIPIRAPRAFRRGALKRIGRHAQCLLRRRRIAEQRQAPLASGGQRLVWLDGEDLCASPEFQEALGPRLPADAGAWEALTQERVFVEQEPNATLFCLRSRHPFARLWSWLTGKRTESPALAAARLLLRLERQGVGTPRLLGYGQRTAAAGALESFLLTAPPADSVPLSEWLVERSADDLWTAQRKQRWRIIRETGQLLRRLHENGCFLHGNAASADPGRSVTPGGAARLGNGVELLAAALPTEPIQVQVGPTVTAGVVLADARAVLARRRPEPWRRLGDLRWLLRSLPNCVRGGTDCLRFFLAYLDIPRLDPASRRLARRALHFTTAPKAVARNRQSPVVTLANAWAGSASSSHAEQEVGR